MQFRRSVFPLALLALVGQEAQVLVAANAAAPKRPDPRADAFLEKPIDRDRETAKPTHATAGDAETSEAEGASLPPAPVKDGVEPAAPDVGLTLESLLTSNNSRSLLDLNDDVLANASRLIAHARKAKSLSAPTRRREEEATVAELAAHSGQLQRLFKKLEQDLESSGEEESLDVYGPDSHSQLDASDIEPIPTMRVDYRPKGGEKVEGGRAVLLGFLVALVFGGATIGLCCIVQNRLRPEPLQKAKPVKTDGETSYVIRITKVRIIDLPSRAPLAWQLSLAGDKPRPSRFTKDTVWDAPVDKMDVDIEDPREKISVAVLAASESLEPPTTVATVDVPAGVLLAEAKGNREKVKSSGDSAYVHEKKLALYPRGELVLEYSLIAFFHWYVGSEEPTAAK